MTKAQHIFLTIWTITAFMIGVYEPIGSLWKQATPLTFMLSVALLLAFLPEKYLVHIRRDYR
jgi:hypothetical protein